MEEILLIVDSEGKFRQDIQCWDGIDLKKYISVIETNGYKIKLTNYDEIINGIGIKNIVGKKIFYTSSQKLKYKEYMDDILFELSKDNELIPRYEIFKAHENKTYQELYKQRIGINSLDSYSFGCLKDICKYEHNIKFPVVLKLLTGAGGAGVTLAKNFTELETKIKNNTEEKFNLSFEVKKLLKKYVFKKRYHEGFYGIDKNIGRYMLQEFVPNLNEDWKVLVFGEKYYVLNRKTRENDFRASGSGKLSYLEAPLEVLKFAKECFTKLNIPVASFDVCIDSNQKCYLVEYQGLHFGPYTLMYSNWYYENKNDIFIKKEGKSDLAKEYAGAHINFLKRSN